MTAQVETQGRQARLCQPGGKTTEEPALLAGDAAPVDQYDRVATHVLRRHQRPHQQQPVQTAPADQPLLDHGPILADRPQERRGMCARAPFTGTMAHSPSRCFHRNVNTTPIWWCSITMSL